MCALGTGVQTCALPSCLTPDATLRKLKFLGEGEHIPVPPGMLAQLTAGNAGNRAVQAAWRRLRASGLSPAFDIKSLPQLGGLSLRRVGSEEHTSELQSLMRISYAVFCLKKKKTTTRSHGIQAT